MDFLFVNPPTPCPRGEQAYDVSAPPLGIAYVASALREAGFTVAAVDLALARDPAAELEQQMRAHQPRVLGFYSATISHSASVRLRKIAKELDREVQTWIGGPHVSYEYEHALEVDGFDTVFLFEAEASAVEAAEVVLRGKGRLDDVGGIAFLRDGAVVTTSPRAREKILDTLPYPARDLFSMKSYSRPGNIMSSRGCPLKCIFCIASTFEDAYRYRSPDNVVGELRQMYETWGINDFYFVDNVFTTHRARAAEIARKIRMSGLPVGWYCVSRVDYVSPVLMQELASGGCYRIELGVESADLGVIDTIKKRIKIEQVKRAADIILNLGMQPMFTFQVGHPDDTLDTIEATLKLAEEMRELGAGTYLAITTPYPGTPLRIGKDAFGIKLETDDWDDYRWSWPTYSTKNFTRNDLRRAVFRDGQSMLAAVRSGKLRDPASAPWNRFNPNNPPVRLPPPPKEPDAAKPLEIENRSVAAQSKQRSLPVLQVAR